MLSLTHLSDYGIDPSTLPIHPDITTFDNPANHVVGGGLDGVVELMIDGQFLCTGTLLPTRRHVLTAAHCIAGAESADVIFPGNQTFAVMADNQFVDPNFTGDPRLGADIGIIELDEEAPAGMASFEIRRAPVIAISVIDVAGYGVAGQGIEQFFDGNKRNGSNRYELFFDAGQTMIMYDFDNGNAANDSIGIATGGGIANTGLGNLEVLAVSGDSGSPAFIGGLIAGVHSFRTTLLGGVGDAVPGLNGSFGELSVDGLTSASAGFIDAIIIDEPGAPRITDVFLEGSSWIRDPYSFADIVPTGKQLAPIFTQGIDTIQIEFGEHVFLRPPDSEDSEFSLVGSNDTLIVPSSLRIDPMTHVATWTFDDPLPPDKYRIELTTIVEDVRGDALDGEWMNIAGPNAMAPPTYDNFMDDQTGRTFLTGDGNEGSTNNRFELFFSLLPGDRNRDGLVTSADTTATGDVNGDGASNSTDATIVQTIIDAAVDTSLPLRNRFGPDGHRGDYFDDEMMSVPDYARWKTTFGSVSIFDADGNGNNWVDTADYNGWRDNLYIPGTMINAHSGWYTGPIPPVGGGGGGPIVQMGEAPRVANVTISGSNSAHAPYSFDAHDGSGEQLRTVPVGAADTVSVSVSEDVNITADTLTLTGLRTANHPTLAEFSYDIGTMTASWRFTGWAIGDQFAISLSDAVTDVEGNQLDGEWTNPASLFTTNAAVSEFPSGNSEAGGDFNFVMRLLPGDATLNNIFDSADMDIFNESWMSGLIDALFTDGDASGDGYVNSTDWYFMANLGLNLQSIDLLADLNGDFKVDDADLGIFTANLNMQNPTQADGDLNLDGDIDNDDLNLVFAQYGLALNVVS